ncbi:MAG: prephenate dehydratase [Candidatus Bathyarchaeia archaeon]
MSESIELRKMIDRIDEKLLELLAERTNLVRKIGLLKRKLKIPIRDLKREREIYSRIIEIAKEKGLNENFVKNIFDEIIAMSSYEQGEEIKVAFLGPRGTFCEQATRKFFHGFPASFIEFLTIKDVFRAVLSDEVNYGVVPVENSTEGSISLTLDLLLNYEIKVYGEIEQKATHNLIVKPGTKLEKIKLIISHPQALAQCRIFLEENLPKAKIKEVSSTSAAVKALKRLRNAAAVGSELAAEIYGCEILARGIEDNPENYTRFFVLSKKDGEPSGNDKTSIIYSVEHVPGALFRSLEPFAKRKINLTKIESRPTRKKPWDYVFFVDFEGHRDEVECREALEELKNICSFIKILGSYPKAQ